MLPFTAALVMFMATEKPVSCHVLSRRLIRATPSYSLALLLQQKRPTGAPASPSFCSEHSHPTDLFWAFHRTCSTLPCIFFFQAMFSDTRQGWEGAAGARSVQVIQVEWTPPAAHQPRQAHAVPQGSAESSRRWAGGKGSRHGWVLTLAHPGLIGLCRFSW